MGKVLVNGATFSVDIDPSATLVAGAFTHTLVVNSSDRLNGKDGSQKAALKSDMEGQTPLPGLAYTTPSYPIPGAVTWQGDLNGSQESVIVSKSGSGVVVDDTPSGSTNFSVTAPASRATPPPLTDPNSSYGGSWSLSTTNNDRINTVES